MDQPPQMPDSYGLKPNSGVALFLADLVSQKALGLGILVFCLLLGLIYWFRAPTTYDAKVSLLPNLQYANADLLGTLASFTGVQGLEESSYEQLYGEILKSDRILDSVLFVPWQASSNVDSLSNFAILGLSPQSFRTNPQKATNKAKRILRTQCIHFTREKFTGYMKLRVRLPEDPQAAANLANLLAAKLGSMLENLRISNAVRSRDFVRERLAAVESKLFHAEQNLVEFRENNRDFERSPRLSSQFGELRRETEALTSMWVTLKRELETSEIEVNKQNVSLKVLDSAIPPTGPSGPNILKIALLSFFMGVLMGIMGIMLRLQLPSLRIILKG